MGLTRRLESIFFSCSKKMPRYVAWSNLEGSCEWFLVGFGEGVGCCTEGVEVKVVRACGEEG